MHLSDFTQSNCAKDGNWNDCISSLWNYGVPSLLNHMDNGDPDLTDNTPNWNDQISSNKWCVS